MKFYVIVEIKPFFKIIPVMPNPIENMLSIILQMFIVSVLD